MTSLVRLISYIYFPFGFGLAPHSGHAIVGIPSEASIGPIGAVPSGHNPLPQHVPQLLVTLHFTGLLMMSMICLFTTSGITIFNPPFFFGGRVMHFPALISFSASLMRSMMNAVFSLAFSSVHPSKVNSHRRRARASSMVHLVSIRMSVSISLLQGTPMMAKQRLYLLRLTLYLPLGTFMP